MAGFAASTYSLPRMNSSQRGVSRLVLWPRNRVSRKRRLRQAETGSTIFTSEGVRPNIWCCRDHSAGRSQRRATPMPRGSRPSMAALTRSGARNASEIVMLSFRALQPSRFAMVSTFGVGSVISSSSQRRLLRSVDGVVVPHHRSPITAICRRGAGSPSVLSTRN